MLQLQLNTQTKWSSCQPEPEWYAVSEEEITPCAAERVLLNPGPVLNCLGV